MKKIKILFFTPFAGYTGSEMMLLYLLSNLDKEKFEVKLFAGKKGELLDKFPKNIEINYAIGNSYLLYRLFDKLLKKMGLSSIDDRRILKLHKKFTPDYWYINTMIMSNIVNIALENNVKYIVHFHELLSQYNYISWEELKSMVFNASYTVGCSENVCNNLITLGAKNIQKQYECVDFSKIKIESETKVKLKIAHKIKETDFIIVMSGQRIDRKGFDIFVRTACRLKNSGYHFLWLGASKKSGYEFFLENLMKANTLTNITILAPKEEEYYNYMNLADLFFLTSIEDPFPLVMLEASYLGLPILAFNSGGSSEFVKPSVGKIIEEITNNAIDENIEWMKNAIERKTFIKKDIQKYAEQYDVKNQIFLFENWLTQISIS